MRVLTEFDLDDTGKIDLTTIYDRPDPRPYFQTLKKLEYRIPAAAEPVFRRVVAAIRAARAPRHLTVLDVGSSYGVNAAILKHDCELADMFARYTYTVGGTADLSRGELIARDRVLYRAGDPDLTVIGLDTSAPAIAYATEAGIMDDGVVADLETRAPNEREAALMAGVDLVISTGAIGYVGAPTFSRILDAARRPPWLALFALRMFPIDDLAATLARRGYAVFTQPGQSYRQRRFASADERQNVLANLDDLGIDPGGHESEGWYHAGFFFARPAAEDVPPPVRDLVAI
jgi:carnitine O-acetyltransferase